MNLINFLTKTSQFGCYYAIQPVLSNIKIPSTNSKTNVPIQNMVNTARYLDPLFKCSDQEINNFTPTIQNFLESAKSFNVAEFLRGSEKRSSKSVSINDLLIREAIDFVNMQAKQIAKEQNITLQNAYKKLIGILDKFDDESSQQHILDKSYTPLSTFILRSAILLASSQEGIGLESWMVYTKSGKPTDESGKPADEGKLWRFLEQWKNWVPEAHGAMAKFTEITLVKTRQMANKSLENDNKNKVILLKGGFGAGKTRLANQLMGENASGVVAPDACKRVVRRSMETVTHAAAHVQGSGLAYTLFDEMISKQKGTIVYDSSLSRPQDIKEYLEKCKKAHKKMVVYDVARHDMARILSILKRSVEGEDPRIPPSFIVTSAIRDKLNRVECMKTILNDLTEDVELRPEYHFMGANETGWDLQEVMLLSSKNSIELKHGDAKNRLLLEGLKITSDGKIEGQHESETLKTYFQNQFELPVKKVMEQLSEEEKGSLNHVFEQRKLTLTPNHMIANASDFYEALPLSIKKVLSIKAVEDSFNGLTQKTREAFFSSLALNSSISYLDLPLLTALIIHQNLQKDPWI